MIEAERFALRDPRGRIRAELSVEADGRAALDRDERNRAVLSLLPDGSPGLALLDRDGKSSVGLLMRADGAKGLGFIDRDGKNRAEL